MEQFASVLAWPVVVLIIVLVAFILFRLQLSEFISRTKKVSKGGIETFEGQPLQPTEEKKGVEEFFRSFDSPLLVEGEQLILNELKDQKIEVPADREKMLIRTLASTNIVLHFERAYGDLWASQLECLRYLNPRDQGAELAEIAPFYELAKTEYPSWYVNHPFDRWLGFLRSFNLVLERDSLSSLPWLGESF